MKALNILKWEASWLVIAQPWFDQSNWLTGILKKTNMLGRNVKGNTNDFKIKNDLPILYETHLKPTLIFILNEYPKNYQTRTKISKDGWVIVPFQSGVVLYGVKSSL